MAAKPKMTPEQWASAKAAWQVDPREGYAWLVEELGLDVSAPGVRKTAIRDGWAKVKSAVPVPAKGKVSKVSQNGTGKVSQAAGETIRETLPETMGAEAVDAEDTVDSPVQLLKVEREVYAALTPSEERFADEYLIDLNATQAYMRVFPHITLKSAGTLGPRMLGKVGVAEKIFALKKERSERTGMNADRALADVWAVATADARDLVQVKVGCCRHCYGEGHQRQRTVGEMNRDREKHAIKSSKAKEPTDFDEEGGIGFNRLRVPHPMCPECCGDGNARVVLMDTRDLSPQAAALYAGAKEGKHGIEVLMHGKAEAQRKVFEHLGLNKQVVEVNVNLFPPREVLDAIYSKALAEAAQMEANLANRRERLGINFEKRDIDE